MNDSKKLLKSILGDQGYETLEKAIFKQKTSAVIDPLEYYLPLIVVPRTIISWLVHNIKPMKPGNILDTKFPGRDDIAVHFEKQGDDQYRAEFVRQGGKIIHTFEKQSLPAVSGHIMTVGELYDSFADDPAPADLKPDEPKSEGSGLDVVREMVSMANVKPSEDPENVKWQMSHANVREMTAVIGKLVDALCAKQMSRDKFESELDKVAEKEVKDQQGKISEGTSAEEVGKKLNQALNSNPDIKEPGEGYNEVRDLKNKPSEELVPKDIGKLAPENKGREETPGKEKPFKKESMQIAPVPESRKMPEPARVTGNPQAEAPFKKESMAPSMQAAKNISSPRMAGAEQDQHKQKGILQRISPDSIKKDALAPHAPADTRQLTKNPQSPVAQNPKLDKCSGYFRKKAELLTKPYVSDAQRRWAHTESGTKALGGESHVHEWDESTKGKKLPEHVKKEEMIVDGWKHQGAHATHPVHGKIYRDSIIGDYHGEHPKAGKIVGHGDLKGLKAHMAKLSEQHADVKKEEKGKQVGPNSVATGTGGMANIKHPKGGGFDFPLLASEKMGKSDMPKGAGQPNGPAKPLAPKAPVPPSNAPAQAAAKQAQNQAAASGNGGYKPPQTPGAVKPKNPDMQKAAIDEGKTPEQKVAARTERNDRHYRTPVDFNRQGMHATGKTKAIGHPKQQAGVHLHQENDSPNLRIDSDRGKGGSEMGRSVRHVTGARAAGLGHPSIMRSFAQGNNAKVRAKIAELKAMPKPKLTKANATEDQLYKSACPNCGVPEFKKDQDGFPKFNPCACFLVMTKDEEGKPYKFVQTIKKSDGTFNLAFAKDADPETVKLFLLTLKSALLIKKNLVYYEHSDHCVGTHFYRWCSR